MKVLFLTIALSLFSILQAQDSSSSEEQFEGTYFVKAIVTDSEFFEKNKPKALSPLTVTHLSNGDLEAKFTTNMNGICEEIKMKFEKTDKPGIFSTNDGSRQVLIEKTSVRDHWILFCEGELHGMQVRIAKLLGPHTDENPKAFQEFKKFVSLKRFNEEKINIPRQTETCIPEHV
ncbi:late lactation protein B [Notamacropus eugenii]|uniref:Late lactation protein B n=1 Tax=Notamacropus eugenii TaxID=9315 RepID=LLPB_NOTEU|nr:RecName: Full=Late lactation protein B; Short=LLP-B; Flags: Precursor [Notamacropus eugenii]AAL85634.1 late lactation protein B precursor [Notamacropus eugenii]